MTNVLYAYQTIHRTVYRSRLARVAQKRSHRICTVEQSGSVVIGSPSKLTRVLCNFRGWALNMRDKKTVGNTEYRTERLYKLVKNVRGVNLQSTVPTLNNKLEKLSLIEDRGQTDRVTALPRPYTIDIDI